MADTDIRQTTTTGMKGAVPDFKVSPKILDTAGAGKETYWINPYWTKYLGYYKSIPELKKSIDALATWTAGKGWIAEDARTEAILNHITGWGEDSFQSIMENMIIVKKINGDSFAEIIKDDNDLLLNLKPLNPFSIRIVANKKGIITRYDELGSNEIKRSFNPDNIFHLCNDRVANEIHGTSVIEACQWVIDARNEAMADWRRILHRSTIRVIEVDSDDPSKLSQLKVQYADAIKNGEVLIIPKDNVGFPNAPLNFIDPQTWISYLENFFYQAVGIPKIILGGSQEFTEASSKIGYLTFEQIYMREQRELETDIKSQIGLGVKFERPISLKSDITQSEAANTGQTGFQPNETETGVTRNE